MGHTHRMGIASESAGFEVGNLTDMRSAGYLQSGAANWQAGFGMLEVADRRVTPALIPMQQDGSFVYEGRVWR